MLLRSSSRLTANLTLQRQRRFNHRHGNGIDQSHCLKKAENNRRVSSDSIRRSQAFGRSVSSDSIRIVQPLSCRSKMAVLFAVMISNKYAMRRFLHQQMCFELRYSLHFSHCTIAFDLCSKCSPHRNLRHRQSLT
jgi:hypothetical protein